MSITFYLDYVFVLSKNNNNFISPVYIYYNYTILLYVSG